MAEIVGVHGIKGAVKLKVFAESPEDLQDYGTFTDDKGQKTFEILTLHDHGNIYLADLKGVTDRDVAEKLRGTKLCIRREQLRTIKKKDTFYYVDLVGLAAKHVDGSVIGKVVSVANFGAGDLIEIKPAKGASFYVPFTDAVVPKVDIEGGEITIDPPPGLMD